MTEQKKPQPSAPKREPTPLHREPPSPRSVPQRKIDEGTSKTTQVDPDRGWDRK